MWCGVQVGDRLVGVGGVWMQGYEEAAAAVPAQRLPLTVVFRRGPVVVVPLRDTHSHHAAAARER